MGDIEAEKIVATVGELAVAAIGLVGVLMMPSPTLIKIVSVVGIFAVTVAGMFLMWGDE